MIEGTQTQSQQQEIPLPLTSGDRIVGDDVEITFKTYVRTTALVRFYDQFGREQTDGLASFKQWLADQDELTIRRD